MNCMSDKVSFGAVLIPQDAEYAGASILYSEDLVVGQHDGALQVVNPLVDSAAR
jgi:predicted nucleic acid-binding protein